MKVISLCYTVNEESGVELMPLILKKLEDSGIKSDSNTMSDFGMISLHSCGDLTPNILKIFCQNRNYFKFLASFGCCYHKMEEISTNSFRNFPLSETLKREFAEKHPDFKLTKYAFRVGAQDNL